MQFGKPVWYAMCLTCGYTEVRTLRSNIGKPQGCPDCQSRSERAFPVRYGRRMRDGTILRDDTGQRTHSIPLGTSRAA